ncbi:MAG: choice-of-anchor B domain-containing protein [Rhodothermales bacterium]|jgi:choice-of-anchor B domain-containing protein
MNTVLLSSRLMSVSFGKRAKDTRVALLVVLITTLTLDVAEAQQSVGSLRTACLGGVASGYSCDAVDLLAHLSVEELDTRSAEALDIWGWTDPDTGSEYVVLGMDDRTAFVDISEAEFPRVVGTLRHSGAGPSPWRDVKVYANHAFVVSDRAGLHGLQVFDLTQLRNHAGRPAEFEMTAHYTGFGSAHNIVINETTGFAYAVGSSGGNDCGGGLHMINIQIPGIPRFVGCFAHEGTGRSGSGYTHDAQCVEYHGPDLDHAGKEICFGSNETAVSIADVSVKGQPVALAKAEYPGVAYAHQGWLTEDQRYFILGDELDETRGEAARSLIFDVSDLDDPVFASEYLATTLSIDHNLYVRGDFAYQANYTSGLRILDVSDPTAPVEVGFFDTTPNRSGLGFAGTWSSYPYFESGVIAVSSIDEGLFILQPTHPALSISREPASGLPTSFTVGGAFPNPFDTSATVEVNVQEPGVLRVALVDLLGREIAVVFEGDAAGGTREFVLDGSGLSAGTYIVEVRLNGSIRSRVVTRR